MIPPRTSDPRLDRRPEFDPRSRGFPIRSLLTITQQEVPPRSYTWSLPAPMPPMPADTYPLDQGSEGACVGFSWSHELAFRPRPIPGVTDLVAQGIYHEAQRVDEWPGEDYDGTSVLAGAKVVAARGLMSEYRWAFGLDDVVRTVAYKGPVVLGINWYTGMMRPDGDGRIRPTGELEGGHAILLPRITGERYTVVAERRRAYLYNSWGRFNGWPWGWLSWDDLARLLAEQGEACIPVTRLS